MGSDAIRTLLLPNKEHSYGSSLQASLQKCGVETLQCDAGWGFELHKHIQIIADLSPDILHLQWPEALCRAEEAEDLDVLSHEIEGALAQIESMGIPIVWTMHNLRPHRIFNLDFQSRLYGYFAAHATGVIHHSHSGMRRALETYHYWDSARHGVIRHGYFSHGAECLLSREEARERLGLPAEAGIYLFCGAFRADKNIDILISALGDDDPGASNVLLMVGREQEDAVALYPGFNFNYPNVRWPGRLTYEDLSIYVRAADAFVSAHGDEHLTSAGPHLSQSYLKSQISLSCEYTSEVLGDTAFYFDRGDDAAQSLRKRIASVTPEMLHRASEEIERQRDEYHWDVIGRKTREFYEELLNAR